MRFICRAGAFFLAILSFSHAAHAEWREVSSDHFLIYADDKEQDLLRFATKLERFHAAMDYLVPGEREKPSPSNRVTVYIVDSQKDLRELHSSGSWRVGGFYSPRASGSIAVIPKIRMGGRDDLELLPLYHEYAHHFLWSSYDFAMPSWMSEGAAEFYASVEIDNDGTVEIGRPAKHRAYEIFIDDTIRVKHLFDPERYDTKPLETAGFYGKSWLLYHYLIFSEERVGQIDKYSALLATGTPMPDAALAAFGDFEDLERDLERYSRKRQLGSLRLPPELVPPGPIAIRALSEAEAAIMPVRIRSKAGVDRTTAAEVLVDARAVAQRYPDSAFVLSALAEAEYDAGNDREAIAAADKSIAIDPTRTNAYVQKGYALFRQAEEADDYAAALAAAREPFLALNRIENNHALPLIYFYRSFRLAGLNPPEVALDGLDMAVHLAPFDHSLRIDYAAELLLEGDAAYARRMLQPAAYSPHGGAAAELAQSWLDQLDAGTAPELIPGTDLDRLPEDEATESL